MAPVEQLEPGAGDRPGQELAVGRRSDPVEAPAAYEGGARDGAEAVGRVVLGPGRQLVGEARARSRPASSRCMRSLSSRTMSGLACCQVSSQRVSISCIRTADSFLGAELDQLVQRVGGAARATGGRAGQDEPAHPSGCRMAISWATMPPKEMPDDEAVVPAARRRAARPHRRRSRPWRRARAARCSGPGPAGRRPGPRSSRPGGRRSPGAAGAGRRRCPTCTRSRSPVPSSS